jgi:phosphatidylinositol glycan class H protein
MVPVALLLLRMYIFFAKTIEERVMVIKGYGIFGESRSRLGPAAQFFIAKQNIKHIIINEGITFADIIFYLAVVVAGQDKMVVLFDSLRPKLPILSEVWRDATTSL